KIGTIWAAPTTPISILALSPTVVWLCKVSHSTNNHISPRKFLFYSAFYMLFNTVEFHRRQKMTIRQLRETQCLTTDTRKFFNIGIPRLNVFVSDGPIYTVTIFRICLKVEIAPSISLLSP